MPAFKPPSAVIAPSARQAGPEIRLRYVTGLVALGPEVIILGLAITPPIVNGG